jgi:hypothetical protein
LFAANTGGGDLPQGANEGDILYWNNDSWQILPLGSEYQKLCVCNGQLRWAPYQPSVNTVMAVHDVTESSARMEVELLDNGCHEGEPCIIYSTNPNPTIENAMRYCYGGTSVLSPFVEPGIYSVQLLNLQPATTYYARAYMGNHIAQDYGDVFTFTTQVFELPEIVLNSVSLERSEYDSTYGYLLGDDSLPQFHFYGDFSLSLINTGDGSNANIGIVWSYDTLPTISDYMFQQNAWQYATVGNYSMTKQWTWMSEQLMLPNKDVYFRAFAMTNNLTVYSNEIVIHTAGNEGNIGPAGGYIVLDKGNNVNGWRYLEMAPINVSDSVAWGCYGVEVGSTAYNQFGTWLETAIGSGDTNTDVIIQVCDDSNSAADLVAQWSYGGFSDWFLPSLREMSVMVNSCNALESLPDLNSVYWTSNEVQNIFEWSGNDAYYVTGEGSINASVANKLSHFAVRALRKSNE